MAQWNSGIGTYLKDNKTLFEVIGVASSDGYFISTENRFPVDATIADNAVIGISSGSAADSSDIVSRINIARGATTGYNYINKFGYRENVGGTDAYHTVTSQGAYTFPTSASTAAVSSSNTGEDNGGTVLVIGLDADYNEIEETITIGQTGITTFFRVNRARMVEAGSGNNVNEGNISITVGGETAGYIPAEFGQTNQAVYTIPAGHNGYVFQIDGGVDEKEKPQHLRLMAIDNTVTNPSRRSIMYFVFETSYAQHNQTVPIEVTEKTDLILEMSSPDGSVEMSGGFDLVIRDN